MLIMAVFMAVLLNAKLSLVFLFAIPVLGISLYFIASNAFPVFKSC